MHQPFQFPYADFDIIGDISYIDKVIQTRGFINIGVDDVTSTLSTETVNYVTVATCDKIADALEQSVENLPVTHNNIARMLLQILIPDGHKPDISAMTEFFGKYNSDIDLFWGIAYDKSLTDSISVILIASSK